MSNMRGFSKWFKLGIPIAVGVFIAGVVLAILNVRDSETDTELLSKQIQPINIPAVSTQESHSNPPVISSIPVIFKGIGDASTTFINLSPGLLVLQAEHHGSSNFIVNIVAKSEKTSELYISSLGAYSGTRVHQVKLENPQGLRPGIHNILIQADGEWKFTMAYPDWDVPIPGMFGRSGSGDGVIGPVQLDTGINSVEFSHHGSDTFTVRVLSLNGEQMELIVNTKGPYDRSIDIEINEFPDDLNPGIYAFAIIADGDWEINFGE